MTCPVEAVPQAPADKACPAGDQPANSDNARQQALALLDQHRPAPRRADTPQHDLHVGDIHHVIASKAPNAHRNGHPSTRPAEHDHTKPTDAAPQHPEPPLEPAKQHLVDLISDKLKDNPTALRAFTQNMQDFEKRMMAMSPVEVQRTYTQLAKLMESPSTNASANDRVDLAQQILRNAAHPEVGISQGLSNTCASASLESRAYAQAPGEAAKMVTDLALTGSFTTSDGTTISPKSGISHPYANDGFTQPGRTYASQLFQVGAMNIYVDMINKGTKPPGNYRYALDPSTDKMLPYEEHIYNDSTHPPTDSPSMGIAPDENTVSAMYASIVGKSAGESILSSNSISSLSDFQSRLAEANKEGNYPMILIISSSSDVSQTEIDDFKNTDWYKQYHAEHPDDNSVLAPGYHAITIQSYDAKTGKITYTDPELPNHVRETDVATMAGSMNVTLYPDEEQNYFNFQDQYPEKDRYNTESEIKYFQSLPPAERQAQFDKLAQMKLIYPGDLSQAQLKALGLIDPRPVPSDAE